MNLGGHNSVRTNGPYETCTLDKPQTFDKTSTIYCNCKYLYIIIYPLLISQHFEPRDVTLFISVPKNLLAHVYAYIRHSIKE